MTLALLSALAVVSSRKTNFSTHIKEHVMGKILKRSGKALIKSSNYYHRNAAHRGVELNVVHTHLGFMQLSK
jgi:hypothetical protein